MVCCTPKPGEGLDLRGFAEHLRRHLPRYAVPRFLRLRAQLCTTSTFKHEKSALKAAGCDPAESGGDPLFLLAPGSAAWQPLDEDLKRRIEDGELSL
jgi:citronellyl-CoA synthetase